MIHCINRSNFFFFNLNINSYAHMELCTVKKRQFMTSSGVETFYLCSGLWLSLGCNDTAEHRNT